jgi:glycosyltransferase involved in cell wall biosynthesis
VPFDLIHVPPRAYLHERRSMLELIRRHHPDVVHTHGYRPDIMTSGLARRLGIPVVTTVHGSSRMGGVTRLYEWLQWRAFRTFDAVIAVSRPLQHALVQSGVRPERTHLIPNAWVADGPALGKGPARELLGVDPPSPLIGWVGRLIPAKGADIFLRALASVQDAAWHSVIIGDGPERPALEALARELGIADRITFNGAADDAGQLFPAFDVYVLSSRTEGTPMVLFEAMAAQVPIVAARVGGVPDVLSTREAWLPAGESSVELAAAIRSALADPADAHARALSAALCVAERFSPQPWLDRHEQLYLSLLADPVIAPLEGKWN